jgi:50S ribosomal subunit-associated GTPase HflX
MFTLLNEYEEHKARCAAIRRQCEHIARIREARRQRASDQPFYAFALVGVGRALIGVGSRLQNRYSPDERYPTPAKANY